MKKRKEENGHTDNVAGQSGDSYYCVICSDDAEEDMIRCLQCKKWIHTACAGVKKTDRFYICDFCTM